MATFMARVSSVKTLQSVTSLPVPAVVGMATMGSGRLRILCRPT